MKKTLVTFGSSKFKEIPSYAVSMFYEAIADKGWTGVTIAHAYTEEVNSKNSHTEIWFRRPSAPKKFKGGITWSMEKMVWTCDHANDFSCSSSNFIDERSGRFPDFERPVKKMYLVEFRAGGWNSVMACNQREAETLAHEAYEKYGIREVRPLSKKEYDMMVYMDN
jgi:hypothetical protein